MQFQKYAKGRMGGKVGKLYTSHPASKASLKKPSEIECLAADSESLIWDIQYDADDKTLNFFRIVVLETLETGVSLFPWPVAELLTLASEIGVMLPASFGTGRTVDLAGMESLLGGLTDLSLLERSRTPTLLLTLAVEIPLKNLKIKSVGFESWLKAILVKRAPTASKIKQRCKKKYRKSWDVKTHYVLITTNIAWWNTSHIGWDYIYCFLVKHIMNETQKLKMVQNEISKNLDVKNALWMSIAA